MSLHCATHNFCNFNRNVCGGRGWEGELDCVDRILLREIPVPEALNKNIRHEEGEGLAMKNFFFSRTPIWNILCSCNTGRINIVLMISWRPRAEFV